jgi:2-keto-4-pentenoate hydratase/2-oxohepta-3-ene-1,7-dioic acid hydratase in catechol pathway
MRIISYELAGVKSFGIVKDDGVVDARRHLDQPYEDLRALLVRDGLQALRNLQGHDPDHALSDITYLPVIDNPAAKILCIGVNYMPHIREMGRERPDYPVVFVRFANSLVGHGADIVKPTASEQFDFEGELAVIIGKRARHVTRENALDYVAGFSCFNDGSVRDFQKHGLQWTPGKNFPRSGAIGPWLVTVDEQPNPAKMQMKTLLNGNIVQNESVGELCFGVPELIEYISTWTELEPGDVIATGTPGGVGAGRKPPLWMQAGDVIEVDISGVGLLRNQVAAENAP